MNTFFLRAECEIDAIRLWDAVCTATNSGQFLLKEHTPGEPDKIVAIQTRLTRDVLNELIGGVPDGHTMLRTLEEGFGGTLAVTARDIQGSRCLSIKRFTPSFQNPAVWTDDLMAMRQAEYLAYQATEEGIAEQQLFDDLYSEFETSKENGNHDMTATKPIAPRAKGTQDFGEWHVGQTVSAIDQLKVGQYLVSDNQQLDAVNLCEVTKVDSERGVAHARFVDPLVPGQLRSGANAEGFSIWDFELKSQSNPYSLAKNMEAPSVLDGESAIKVRIEGASGSEDVVFSIADVLSYNGESRTWEEIGNDPTHEYAQMSLAEDYALFHFRRRFGDQGEYKVDVLQGLTQRDPLVDRPSSQSSRQGI